MSKIPLKNIIEALENHNYIAHFNSPHAEHPYWVLTTPKRSTNDPTRKREQHERIKQAIKPLADIINTIMTNENYLEHETLKKAVSTYLSNKLPYQPINSKALTAHKKHGLESAFLNHKIIQYDLDELIEDNKTEIIKTEITISSLYTKQFEKIKSAARKQFITTKQQKRKTIQKEKTLYTPEETINALSKLGVNSHKHLFRLARANLLDIDGPGWQPSDVKEIIEKYQENKLYKHLIDHIINKK